jgi:predicted esterase
LQLAARMWASYGRGVRWERLRQGGCCVSVPTYRFARKRCWLGGPRAEADAIVRANDTTAAANSATDPARIAGAKSHITANGTAKAPSELGARGSAEANCTSSHSSSDEARRAPAEVESTRSSPGCATGNLSPPGGAPTPCTEIRLAPAPSPRQAPSRPLRLLCLHGWRTNSELLGVQLAPLRAQLGDDAELVFVEGVRATAVPADAAVGMLSSPPYYEYWREDVGADGSIRYSFEEGLRESVEALERAVRQHGPFDALVGFSQGATLAALLSALRFERALANESSPLLAEMPQLSHLPPWRAVVLLCAVFPESPLIPRFDRHCMPIEALHVVGTSDVHCASGRKLVGCFNAATSRLFEHAGGHEMTKDSEQNIAIARHLHALRQ